MLLYLHPCDGIYSISKNKSSKKWEKKPPAVADRGAIKEWRKLVRGRDERKGDWGRVVKRKGTGGWYEKLVGGGGVGWYMHVHPKFKHTETVSSHYISKVHWFRQVGQLYPHKIRYRESDQRRHHIIHFRFKSCDRVDVSIWIKEDHLQSIDFCTLLNSDEELGIIPQMWTLSLLK